MYYLLLFIVIIFIVIIIKVDHTEMESFDFKFTLNKWITCYIIIYIDLW